MKQTLVITKNQKNILQQILSELIYALNKTFAEKDLLKLSYQILRESGIQTYDSKKEITIKLFKSVKKLSAKAYLSTKVKFYEYKKNGFKRELMHDYNFTTQQIGKSPKHILNIGRNLKNNSNTLIYNFIKKPKVEKIEAISVGIIAVLVFFASVGGKDFEGGIPDSDLNMGIGFHRNFISHSIIMGFIIEFLMRSGIEILNKSYKNLPEHHHAFWDKSNNYLNKHKGVAIGAMWAGISAHLLKDSGIFGNGFRSYTGIPIKLTMNTHQSLFVANGLASAIFAFYKVKTKK